VNTAIFDSPLKYDADFLFDFWTKVRSDAGAALPRYCALGLFSPTEVRTPPATYGYVRKPYYTSGFVLIQHGSYQWISEENQPLIESGDVVLYRGIGQAGVFRQLRFQPDELSSANREIWRGYLALQAKMLSDSVLSFNTIHDRIRRCETGGLRDGMWLADQLIADAGLDIQAPGFAKDLWESAQQFRLRRFRSASLGTRGAQRGRVRAGENPWRRNRAQLSTERQRILHGELFLHPHAADGAR